jgi:membrane-bound lytic murein transglycosylase D
MEPAMRDLALILLACLVLAPAARADEAPLPRPAGLEPNVRFWTRVYTEVDTQSGLIHDSENLDVVYEVVRFPSGLSARAREQQVERAKRRLRAALERLARGERNGLDSLEQHVLALWPGGSSNATFRRAASDLRFQLGQADKFRAGLIRQGAWKDYIEGILADHGVPRELRALPHVESSYNTKAYSRVGAAGLWQFMRSTGRLYMRVDNVVDERLDPFAATAGAARLLRDNYRRLEAWPLAITAYNHGVGGMQRAVQRVGTRDIAAIVDRYESKSFGFASRNFYSEFLAASEIDHHAERYFGPLPLERPVEYEVVEMPHYVPASTLARALGLDLAELQEHNQALRPSVWSGSKFVPQGYSLRVPKRGAPDAAAVAIAQIPSADRMERQHRDRLYKVQRGDTLSKIASRYGVSERELVALNNLRNRNAIKPGQVLTLPDEAQGKAPASVVAEQSPPEDGVYLVGRGDSLSTIARRFGVPLAQLVALNGLRDRHQLTVGQKLRLFEPRAEPIAVAAAEPAPAREAAPPEPAPVAEPEVAPPEPAPAEPPAPLELALAELDLPEEVVSEVGPAAGSEPEEEEAELEVTAADSDAAAQAPVPSAQEIVAGLASDPTIDASIPSEAVAEGEDAAIEPAAAAPQPEPGAPAVPGPADYAVEAKGRIVVQAEETLGHYAEWLEVGATSLRKLNGMRTGAPVVIGRKVRLDFSRVTPEAFERRRLEYHRTLQEEFFGSYKVTGTDVHTLRRGETLWFLARRKYELPIWLLRQYNPDLDLAGLAPGDRLVIPRVEARQG